MTIQHLGIFGLLPFEGVSIGQVGSSEFWLQHRGLGSSAERAVAL
jgi:hypothetical protein